MNKGLNKVFFIVALIAVINLNLNASDYVDDYDNSYGFSRDFRSEKAYATKYAKSGRLRQSELNANRLHEEMELREEMLKATQLKLRAKDERRSADAKRRAEKEEMEKERKRARAQGSIMNRGRRAGQRRGNRGTLLPTQVPTTSSSSTYNVSSGVQIAKQKIDAIPMETYVAAMVDDGGAYLHRDSQKTNIRALTRRAVQEYIEDEAYFKNKRKVAEPEDVAEERRHVPLTLGEFRTGSYEAAIGESGEDKELPFIGEAKSDAYDAILAVQVNDQDESFVRLQNELQESINGAFGKGRFIPNKDMHVTLLYMRLSGKCGMKLLDSAIAESVIDFKERNTINSLDPLLIHAGGSAKEFGTKGSGKNHIGVKADVDIRMNMLIRDIKNRLPESCSAKVSNERHITLGHIITSDKKEAKKLRKLLKSSRKLSLDRFFGTFKNLKFTPARMRGKGGYKIRRYGLVTGEVRRQSTGLAPASSSMSR